jgi:3-dehydroquinate synthase II
MKNVWVKAIPWRKELVIDALEAGADAVVVEEGRTAEVKSLGLITTVAPDGDLKPGTDVFEVTITSREDEQTVRELPTGKPVIVRPTDWTIIPLENLIAQRPGIMLEVTTPAEAQTALGILEKGVDGIIVNTRDSGDVRAIIAAVTHSSEALDLVEAGISRVLPLTMGDRVCIDTCTSMHTGQGMLIGNSSAGMFLVHSETVDNPYVEPRPFRVNAGPVHAYARVPGGRTRYLSELRSGDPVLVVGYDGRTEAAVVGRVKVEKRPLLFVEAFVGEQPYTLILQNAETIRLTSPEGKPVSVVQLQQGTRVLMHVERGGRHFGMAIDETITER